MISSELYKHQLYDLFRSSSKYRNIFSKILLTLYIFLSSAFLFAYSLMLPMMFGNLFPNKDVVESFASFIPAIIILGILMRIFVQPMTSLNINQYRLLPIPRDTLIRYVVTKPLINPLNYLGLFVFLPYCVMSAWKYGMGTRALLLFFCGVAVIIFNIMCSSYIKRRWELDWKFLSAFLALVVVLALPVYFNWFDWVQPVLIFSGTFFSSIVAILSLVGFSVLFYILHVRVFKNFYYEKDEVSSSNKIEDKLSFMAQYGVMGQLTTVQIKQFVRPKFLRSVMKSIGLYFIMGLMFAYFEHDNKSSSLGYLFTLCLPQMMFAQFIYRANCSSFDGLLTFNLRLKDYVLSTFYLYQMICLVGLFTSIIGVVLGYLQLQSVLFIYSFIAGLGAYIIFFASAYQWEYQDFYIKKSFSTNSFSFISFVILTLVFLSPVLVIRLFHSNQYVIWGFFTLNMILLIFHRVLIEPCVWILKKNKYKMAAGFRERN
ncbi:DUF5687 family protein [Porphyromonas pogonae]|uniref:DUF5687 family protein n=1 Tax=Porphyromonas pogonae TaxID=867595 RepID=UPI002E7A39C8|nr:DUF5687 family protein [Porphyromonas pogonae]